MKGTKPREVSRAWQDPVVPASDDLYDLDPSASTDAAALSVYREALAALIAARRDVRVGFTGESLNEEALGRVLQRAHEAPSVGNSQPWDFVVVDDPDLKRRFRDHVEDHRVAFEESLDDPERRETFRKLRIEGIAEASAGIVVTYDRERGGPQVLGRASIDETGIWSVCLAIENLWLAATAEGWGVGWVSFYDESFLARLVGLPPTLRPVAWLCVGPVPRLATTPDLERAGWRPRRSIDSVVHRNRYDRRD